MFKNKISNFALIAGISLGVIDYNTQIVRRTLLDTLSTVNIKEGEYIVSPGDIGINSKGFCEEVGTQSLAYRYSKFCIAEGLDFEEEKNYQSLFKKENIQYWINNSKENSNGKILELALQEGWITSESVTDNIFNYFNISSWIKFLKNGENKKIFDLALEQGFFSIENINIEAFNTFELSMWLKNSNIGYNQLIIDYAIESGTIDTKNIDKDGFQGILLSKLFDFGEKGDNRKILEIAQKNGWLEFENITESFEKIFNFFPIESWMENINQKGYKKIFTKASLLGLIPIDKIDEQVFSYLLIDEIFNNLYSENNKFNAEKILLKSIHSKWIDLELIKNSQSGYRLNRLLLTAVKKDMIDIDYLEKSFFTGDTLNELQRIGKYRIINDAIINGKIKKDNIRVIDIDFIYRFGENFVDYKQVGENDEIIIMLINRAITDDFVIDGNNQKSRSRIAFANYINEGFYKLLGDKKKLIYFSLHAINDTEITYALRDKLKSDFVLKAVEFKIDLPNFHFSLDIIKILFDNGKVSREDFWQKMVDSSYSIKSIVNLFNESNFLNIYEIIFEDYTERGTEIGVGLFNYGIHNGWVTNSIFEELIGKYGIRLFTHMSFDTIVKMMEDGLIDNNISILEEKGILLELFRSGKMELYKIFEEKGFIEKEYLIDKNRITYLMFDDFDFLVSHYGIELFLDESKDHYLAQAIKKKYIDKYNFYRIGIDVFLEKNMKLSLIAAYENGWIDHANFSSIPLLEWVKSGNDYIVKEEMYSFFDGEITTGEIESINYNEWVKNSMDSSVAYKLGVQFNQKDFLSVNLGEYIKNGMDKTILRAIELGWVISEDLIKVISINSLVLHSFDETVEFLIENNFYTALDITKISNNEWVYGEMVKSIKIGNKKGYLRINTFTPPSNELFNDFGILDLVMFIGPGSKIKLARGILGLGIKSGIRRQTPKISDLIIDYSVNSIIDRVIK